jgi:hypothetical protein
MDYFLFGDDSPSDLLISGVVSAMEMCADNDSCAQTSARAKKVRSSSTPHKVYRFAR